MEFEPRNPDYEKMVRGSFKRQTTMATLGMELEHVGPGEVRIALGKNDGILQQHGYVHGGVLSTGLDVACGTSALSLAPADTEVLTVEFKTSFFAPATQDRIIIAGKVLKPGRRAIFTEAEAFGIDGGNRVLLAKMSATMTSVEMP